MKHVVHTNKDQKYAMLSLAAAYCQAAREGYIGNPTLDAAREQFRDAFSADEFSVSYATDVPRNMGDVLGESYRAEAENASRMVLEALSGRQMPEPYMMTRSQFAARAEAYRKDPAAAREQDRVLAVAQTARQLMGGQQDRDREQRRSVAEDVSPLQHGRR